MVEANPTIAMPESYPLTPMAFGMTVYVVLDCEQLTAGVYPTPERAFAYATDWVKTGDPTAEVTMQPSKTNSNQWEILVDGRPDYIIEKTHFRM